MMKNRLEKLEQSLAEAGLDALFISKQANERYIEGFTGGDCYLLASGAGNFLIADSRYVEMAGHECRYASVVPYRNPHPPLETVVARIAGELGFKRIGFEGGHLTYDIYQKISETLSAINAEFISSQSMVEKIRAIKDESEALAVAAACRVADTALDELVKLLASGVSELEVKIELDHRLKVCGAEDTGFDTIVLFGARASQPHANSQRDVKLKEGDFILIDYGACLNGYRSDTTRTFVSGRVSDEQKRAYETLLAAQKECVGMVKPGANGRDINERALGMIKEAGFPAFGHGIGHGVGLEIHEEPFLRQNADTILAPGNVVTIEPGIYVPGWGGIRIEDTVLVTEAGHEVLTSYSKELVEL
jgi:Xaa-Pro aminopeptidase